MIHKMYGHTEDIGTRASATQRRKEREKAQRQRQILKAAEKIFAEKGFNGATIQEIALEAELAVGTIYNFFPSKEKLYSMIINSRLDEMREKVMSRIESIPDVKERLKGMLFFQAEFIEKNRDFFLIFFQVQNQLPWTFTKNLGKDVAQRFERYLGTLEAIFKEGVEKNVFKPLSPSDLAEAWAGLCNTFFFKWVSEKPKWSLRSKALTVFEIFMYGVEQ